MLMEEVDICTTELVKGKGHPRTGHEDPEGECRYSSTLSLTSALDGGGGQRHAPAALTREWPGTHCIGGWVGNRADLERRGKLRSIGIRSPGRPVRSELQHLLQYPGSQQNRYATLNQSSNTPHEGSDIISNGAVEKLHESQNTTLGHGVCNDVTQHHMITAHTHGTNELFIQWYIQESSP